MSLNPVINLYSNIEKQIYESISGKILLDLETDSENKAKFTNKNISIATTALKAIEAGLSDDTTRVLTAFQDAISSAIDKDVQQFVRIDVRAIEISKKVQEDVRKHSTLNIKKTLVYTELFAKIKRNIIALLSKQGGISLQEMRTAMQRLIINKSLISGYFERWTYDTYNQYRRAASNEVRKKLGLRYAVYEGGEIDTTRDFCDARNGRVFSEQEIAAWSDLTWKGKPENGYDPFIDLGGYNCRHTLRWITDGLAETLLEKQNLVPALDPDAPSPLKIDPNIDDTLDPEYNFNDPVKYTFAEIGDELSTMDAEFYSKLAGIPDGFENITVKKRYGDVMVEVMYEGVYMERRIGETKIENVNFEISKRSPHKGRGFEIFENQVYAAREMGYKTIETYAAGSIHNTQYNGYYTWMRFGYRPRRRDSEEEILRAMKVKGYNFNNWDEIARTKTGVEIWKEHGYSFEGTFDLWDDSESLKTFFAYKKARNEAKKRKGTN